MKNEDTLTSIYKNAAYKISGKCLKVFESLKLSTCQLFKELDFSLV